MVPPVLGADATDDAAAARQTRLRQEALLRQTVDHREQLLLASYAVHSDESAGRADPEPPHPYRGPFQRDRDRILHSSAFRRLSGKMQVFTDDMGQYHRTRLTHTFEVASVARTLARSLRLNEDLTEALALMHDIGHPPYGHCGEEVLDECLASEGGFSHNQFALTIASQLEQRHAGPPGLNLSAEVLAGQHTRADKASAAQGASPMLEVQVVDVADSIAYDAHDVDDALQLGLLQVEDLTQLPVVRWALEQMRSRFGPLPPPRMRAALVHELIELQVTDFLATAAAQLAPWQGCRGEQVRSAGLRLTHSAQLAPLRVELETFLFQRVYRHPRLMRIRESAGGRLQQMYQQLTAAPERLPLRFRQRAEETGVPRAAGEYLAGMTDRFCDAQHAYLIAGQGPLADW